jgi:glutamate carboxypeptidase
MNPLASLRPFLTAQLPAALDLLRQMVAINSHTLNPAGVNQLGELTARAFAELGFQAETVPSINPAFGRHLILTRRGTGPDTIGFISHLDTVFPPEEERANGFHWRVEGDRIYGPGTEDIKGGTVLMHLMLGALRAVAPDVFTRTNWILLLDASEEMASEDFGRLCVERLRGAKAALVFEAGRREGSRYSLVTARKGRATFRIEVEGRGAHAGGDHPRGASAITQLAHTIQRLETLTDPTVGRTVNIGQISGGGALNRVPHHAWAEGELRAFDRSAYESGLAQVRAQAEHIDVRSVRDNFPCRVNVSLLQETPPWPPNEGTERLFACWQRAATELGGTVDREERGGLSDGNFICHAVPTLDGLGPRGDNAHCSERSADGSKDQEYVEASSFVPKAELNVRALLHLLAGAA